MSQHGSAVTLDPNLNVFILTFHFSLSLQYPSALYTQVYQSNAPESDTRIRTALQSQNSAPRSRQVLLITEEEVI